uniref:Uncharacterized protein n=1 Tax=Anguilla anguilla TaxID=7936 RepID=A0A0E9U030_ANGAN
MFLHNCTHAQTAVVGKPDFLPVRVECELLVTCACVPQTSSP